MLISLEGEEATGKTTFAYTAPLKIVGFSFDLGIERALYGSKPTTASVNIVPYDGRKPVPAWADHDITVYELPAPIQLDQIRIIGCQALWNYYLVLLVKAIEDASVRSIVIDSITQARRVKADAYLESLQAKTEPGKHMREKLLQIEYGTANTAIRDTYDYAAGRRKNLVTIHQLTDERKDVVGKDGQIKEGIVTGNRIVDGFDPKYKVDIVLRMSEKGGAIQGEFRKCGDNLAFKGVTISDPTWDRVVDMVGMSLGDRIKFERRNSIA